MPATEKTWRDQAKMHVLFGISALVMLAGTIWMLAKDHNREWRKWQLADRTREGWTIQAQLKQATTDSAVELTRLEKDLYEARARAIEPVVLEQFKQQVAAEDARVKKDYEEVLKKKSPAESSTADLDSAYEGFVTAQKALDEARAKHEAAPKGEEAEKKKADAELNSAVDDAADARQDLLDEMGTHVREAKRREESLLTEKKFRAADLTAAVSTRGILVGEGKPTEEIETKIESLREEIATLDSQLAAAKDYRIALEADVKQVQSAESDLQKQIAALKSEQARLRDNLGKYTNSAGEWVNRGPVLDALYTGNIKLDQIWLPDMKINYNFSSVARYDRCIVCHRAIDKSAPGTATEPAYPAIPRGERERMVQILTPAAETAQPIVDKMIVDESSPEDALAAVYGLTIAPRGQVDASAVTVEVVEPNTPAAVAGLLMGDVIQEVNGGPVTSRDHVFHYMLETAEWGKPLALKIRRGLDQPFTSHPRLDLFVGSTSPHKKGEMGCTICHDGQGSATEFKWASHTPNDPHQALDWAHEHGWFNNHHWIFPMMPARFIESNCLKCHHEVVDLEPSERFPEPPAPKLVEGYHLVREFGCYGCHEITGFDGPTKRTGPDLRLEPNYSEVASQILTDRGLSPAERELATRVVSRPFAAETRSELARAIQADAEAAKVPADGSQPAAKPRLTPVTHSLADALKDLDTPGSFRKVGPSLRYLNSKVDYNWLYSWIRKPADFRPSTRMPQFFLNYEHLNNTDKAFTIHDAEGKEQKITDLEYTQRFEQIEIRALAQFLLANSQPFQNLGQPQGVTEQPSAERGKIVFETRGCLACHSHVDFPGIHSTQGPDLSRLSAKLNTPKGQQWLYSWVKQPNHYYARTAMPNVFLDPITEKDAAGNATGKVTDPAADVVAYLLSVSTDWKPEAAISAGELTPDEKNSLNELTTVWLSASFPRLRAEKIAKQGIDPAQASSVKVDERVLVGSFGNNEEERVKRQLEYVARRSISRYGCFGCHDIPGYEGAKPIGTPLASWGRKDPAQLAFENIGEFLKLHSDFLPTKAGAASHGAHQPAGEPGLAANPGDHAEGGHAEGHGVNPLDDKFDNDTGYFLQSLNSHERHGFLWQKLRMPRSFDYETTRTKRYDERLRMPKFPFDEKQREAVMTFVLGLTNEAPDARYIYKPSPRQKAIVEGRHVLDKYNCAGCHVLNMDRWDIAFAPNQIESPPTTNDFPFLQPVFTPGQIEASVKSDKRGMLRAELHGMPALDEKTGKPRLLDVDGVPIEPDDKESQPYFEFISFRPALVNGEVRKVGPPALKVQATMDGTRPANGKAYPGLGGDLAKYLYPHVIAEEKKSNPNVVATEAWGWLPPPLHNEGEKVQTDWLHDFLMDPTPIRPAVVLRMPNFHMTGDEASKLVDYFAAISNAEFPYEYNSRRRRGYLAEVEQAHPKLFEDAMKIVTDGNFCVKCHSVGDYQVRGAVKTTGPNLDQVYHRLRPDYVHRWVGNPQRILPYTGMPVNIPYDPAPPNFGGINQALFPGTSAEQLAGIVDLLMNYDEYTRRQTSVKGLVKEAPAAGQPPANPPANPPRAETEKPPNNTAAKN
jgi:cytochrome c2